MSQNVRGQSPEYTAAGDTSRFPYWITMMQDESVDFIDVQRAFYAYFNGRERSKGDGWTQFKRWEYDMLTRISPAGERPDPRRAVAQHARYFGGGASQPARLPVGAWREIGPLKASNPTRGIGRINCVAFHPEDPNMLYAGAPRGGIWISDDKGLTWRTPTNHLPSLGISAIAIDYTNPNIIYAGTGDRDHQYSPGLGILRSVDGGLSWEFFGAGIGNAKVGMLAMHREDPQVILAGSNRGIYKTRDGGLNWTQVTFQQCRDLEVLPEAPNVVIAELGGSVIRSVDFGDTWSAPILSLPNTVRWSIGVTPANPNMVYCISDQGCYRSTDGGASFDVRALPNASPQAHSWYNSVIAVDPIDENIVYSGSVAIFRSTDGGATWAPVGGGSVHVDQHWFEFSPHDGQLYAGNDGGVFVTGDRAISWTDLSAGLGIGLVYDLGHNPLHPHMLMAGFQDSGSSLLTEDQWVSFLGGDGMTCQFDYTDDRYRYASFQNGVVARTSNGVNWSWFGNNVPANEESAAWTMPFVLDGGDPNIMYMGRENMWRSGNIKEFNINDIDWERISSIAATWGNIMTVVQSAADPDLMFIARTGDGGVFHRCENLSSDTPQWTDLSPQLPNTSVPSDIITHPTDPGILYIAQARKVYESTDRGASWTDISGTLPDVGIRCLAFDRTSERALYAGTELGVFFINEYLNDWIPFSEGMSLNADVREMEIYYDEAAPENNVIRAGTYGRGLWESPLARDVDFIPAIAFQAERTAICSGDAVQIFDQSTNEPTSWEWTIEPVGFEFISRTSKNSQNPILRFDDLGEYTVTLRATNEFGDNTGSVENLIRVQSRPEQPQILPVGTDSLQAGEGETFRWYRDGELLAVNTRIIHAEQSGNYEVVTIVGDCESVPSPAFSFTVTGVHESKITAQWDIEIRPNPSDGEFTIMGSMLCSEYVGIEIVSTLGNAVYEATANAPDGRLEHRVDITQLADGVYIARISCGDATLVRTLVK